jgi:hypothetical protein
VAYYDALIAKWATAPAGTTDSKLTWINTQTVTGSVPTTFYTTGADLFNCIVWSEFAALTTAQQANVMAMCQVPGQLLGGSANTTHMTAGMFIAYFNLQGATIAALTALAKATVLPWWQAAVANGGGGLSSPVNHNDLISAGGLT